MTLGFGALGSGVGRVAGHWVEMVRLGDNFLSKAELEKMFPKIDFSVLKEVKADDVCRPIKWANYSKKVCYAECLKDWYVVAEQLGALFGEKGEWKRKVKFNLSECEIKKEDYNDGKII